MSAAGGCPLLLPLPPTVSAPCPRPCGNWAFIMKHRADFCVAFLWGIRLPSRKPGLLRADQRPLLSTALGTHSGPHWVPR